MQRPSASAFVLVVISTLLTAMGCVPQTSPQRPATDADANQRAPVATTFEQVPAKVGVGIKGRSLDEHEGALVTPAKALFAAREKIVFEIQIPHALSLYQATEGNFPKSHDEFMERIVNANNIKLPELPAQHVYVYDPESHELLVRRPAAPGNPGEPGK